MLSSLINCNPVCAVMKAYLALTVIICHNDMLKEFYSNSFKRCKDFMQSTDPTNIYGAKWNCKDWSSIYVLQGVKINIAFPFNVIIPTIAFVRIYHMY